MAETRYVLGLGEVGGEWVQLVGGKAANLGELSRIDGISVPEGFCVTTEAYRRTVGAARGEDARDAILRAPLPREVAAEITDAVHERGDGIAWAVRSSATAEDQPGASFAGQHDTYLNVVGPDAVLGHVRRCWASLFSERAVAYRLRNRIDSAQVSMAVAVQRMVDADSSGVLFTADPVSGDRTVTSIDAGRGLGEALVAGTMTADNHRVRAGAIIGRTVAGKVRAPQSGADAATRTADSAPAHRARPVLTDAQAVELAALGRRIETHFGRPQDIEWCRDSAGFHVVQSRPITTLFPIPEPADDGLGPRRVYVSVGHQQMMTDAMTPLGIAVWQKTSRAPMRHAGGRLFVDVTRMMSTPAGAAGLIAALGESDPRIGSALQTLVERGDFLPMRSDTAPPVPESSATPGDPELIDADPAVVDRLIAAAETSLAQLKTRIRGKSGVELLDVIDEDILELQRVLFSPESAQAITAALESSSWLREHLGRWIDDAGAADTLAQSAPHNVTAQMGLALLDVADAVRPHPRVVEYLREVETRSRPGADQALDGPAFLDALMELPGGPEAREALAGFLDAYGMRCPGEIDLTRPRWGERPSMLVPAILANVSRYEPGESQRLFERGRREAEAAERVVLDRVRALPDGAVKADRTARMIARLRVFTGYREYPKYGMVSRYAVYRQALLGEARRLADDGAISVPEDVFHLRWDELRELVRRRRHRADLIRERRAEFRRFQSLRPPRVLTSDGEVLDGELAREGIPDGAFPGIAVSPGTVEGRARVVRSMADADLEPGDILVTAFTDPSWTPVFVGIRGLVTEVGGVMTHGAVIAREYGLPAVVGVGDALHRIPDGALIRVDGAAGYVEIVDADPPR